MTSGPPVNIRRLLVTLIVRLGTRRQIQKRIHRVFYDFLATCFGTGAGWHFMNYGLHLTQFDEVPISLRPEDAPERLHIQLYHALLADVPTTNSHVLDVGCGRGGGAAYVHRYLTPLRTVGLDLSQKAVRVCIEEHRRRGLYFLAGDAEDLPFRDESFDVVINVESSHAYASMEQFLQEVRRVLRSGGFLVYSDLRWSAESRSGRTSGITLLKRQFASCGLDVVHETDISDGVEASMRLSADRKAALIRAQIPRRLQGIFAELAGLPGTRLYQWLNVRKLVYCSFILQKPRI
jgi:SAM-dependent methyltransferase